MRHWKLQTNGIGERITKLVDGRLWGDVEPRDWYERSVLKGDGRILGKADSTEDMWRRGQKDILN